jgi:hypothetical protein
MLLLLRAHCTEYAEISHRLLISFHGCPLPAGGYAVTFSIKWGGIEMALLIQAFNNLWWRACWI